MWIQCDSDIIFADIPYEDPVKDGVGHTDPTYIENTFPVKFRSHSVVGNLSCAQHDTVNRIIGNGAYYDQSDNVNVNSGVGAQ